jgi:hypothetical protein
MVHGLLRSVHVVVLVAAMTRARRCSPRR